MNWYIGQEIVCIDDSTPKGFMLTNPLKEGQVYTIQGIKSRMCGCNYRVIDVGVSGHDGVSICKVCRQICETGGAWWFNESRFAPLQDLSEQIASLLEQKQIA